MCISALVKCTQLLRDIEEYREANPKLFEIKFNSTNKWALTINKSEFTGKPVLLLKGIPCPHIFMRCFRISSNGWLMKVLLSV